MTVQEMIDKLQEIEDKDKNIYYTDYNLWWDIDIEEGEYGIYIVENHDK